MERRRRNQFFLILNALLFLTPISLISGFAISPSQDSEGNYEQIWTSDTNGYTKFIEISSNGDYIAAATTGYTLYFYEVDSNTPKWTYFMVGGSIDAFAMSSDGAYIAVASENDLYLFGKASSTPIWTNSTIKEISSIDISSDGDYIIVGCGDHTTSGGELYLFQSSSPNPVWNITSTLGYSSVAISKDGWFITAGAHTTTVHRLMAFSRSSTFPLWNISTDDLILNVDISKSGSYILANTDAQKVGYFKLSSSTPLWEFTDDTSVSHIDLSEEGYHMVFGISFDRVVLCNYTDSDPTSEYTPDITSSISDVAISDDGAYYIASTTGGWFYCFSKDQPDIPLWYLEMPSNVYCLDMTSSGRTIVIGGSDLYFYRNIIQDPSDFPWGIVITICIIIGVLVVIAIVPGQARKAKSAKRNRLNSIQYSEEAREKNWSKLSSKKRVKFLIDSAMDYRRKGRYEDAIRNLENAVQLQPENHDAWNKLAITATNARQFDLALKASQQSVNLKPYNQYYLVNRGFVFSARGDTEEAVKSYKRCIDIKPKFMNGWDKYAEFYYDQGKYNDAIKVQKKALKIKTKYALGWNNLGEFYYKAGKYDKAIAACKKAIKYDKKMKIAYMTLAQVYLKLGEYEKAREARTDAKSLKKLLGKTKSTMQPLATRKESIGFFFGGIFALVIAYFLSVIDPEATGDPITFLIIMWVLWIFGGLAIVLFLLYPSGLVLLKEILQAIGGALDPAGAASAYTSEDHFSRDYSKWIDKTPINVKKGIKEVKDPTPLKLVEINGKIIEDSEKALLISFSKDKEVWIPKSVIHSKYSTEIGKIQTFEIDEWILNQHSISTATKVTVVEAPKVKVGDLDLLKKLLFQPKIVEELKKENINLDTLVSVEFHDDVTFCHNCGWRIEGKEVFCNKCGASIEYDK